MANKHLLLLLSINFQLNQQKYSVFYELVLA